MHSFFKFLFKFLKEMLAPNLMRSQISEYIFVLYISFCIFSYTDDGAYLSPLAWLKHAATIDVEMKCIMMK